jgi:hypothetical protein
VLLNCERSELLDKNWYQSLLDQLIAKPADLERDALSVVTFNYDRSLEQYLLDGFEAQLALSPRLARELFSWIRFLHVYGSLGDLDTVRYGQASKMHLVYSKLELVRHGVEHPQKETVTKWLNEAANVAFIGFSFAEENTALFDEVNVAGQECFGNRSWAGTQPNLRGPQNAEELPAA